MFSIGAFGMIALMLMLQYALEKGYKIQPLVELKRDVKQSYEVEDVRVFRSGGGSEQNGNASRDRYWIVTQYRPRSASRDVERLSRAILNHAKMNYRGEHKRVLGFRVKRIAPDREADTVTMIVEDRKGPSPLRVIRSPGTHEDGGRPEEN